VNQPRGEHGRLIPIRNHPDDTEAHRRCSVCREWKGREYYNKDAKARGGIQARCRKCDRKKQRNHINSLSDEEYTAYMRRQNDEGRARRQEKMAERMKDAQFIIKAMMRRGWSLTRIETETGVAREAVSRILRGETWFVYPRTVKKLYEGSRKGV
jgi:hypothetical protein